MPTAELSAVGICLPAERLEVHEQSRSALWVLSDVAKTKDGCLTSTQDVAYTNDNSMARLHTETIPTSTLAATARVVDGFGTIQSDHRGSTLVVERSYSEDKAPDGRKGDWTSPRGLGRGLAKCAAFAPEGRAADGAAPSQPIQWSREYNDTGLGLVYYNYRHYNPADGRWTGRNPPFSMNGYLFSSALRRIDFLGLIAMCAPTYKEVPFIKVPDLDPQRPKIRLGQTSIRLERAPSMEKRGRECCFIVKATKFWIHVEEPERTHLSMLLMKINL